VQLGLAALGDDAGMQHGSDGNQQHVVNAWSHEKTRQASRGRNATDPAPCRHRRTWPGRRNSTPPAAA
jgi:hypothetical protein